MESCSGSSRRSRPSTTPVITAAGSIPTSMSRGITRRSPTDCARTSVCRSGSGGGGADSPEPPCANAAHVFVQIGRIARSEGWRLSRRGSPGHLLGGDRCEASGGLAPSQRRRDRGDARPRCLARHAGSDRHRSLRARAGKFGEMLRRTELVDVPLAQLKDAAERDLAAILRRFAPTCAAYAPGQSDESCIAKMQADKPQGAAVAGAQAQLAGLRRLCRRKPRRDDPFCRPGERGRGARVRAL